MSASEGHRYEIRLGAGQFLRAVFHQRGIDVAIDVLAPGGEKMADVDTPNGSNGPEAVEVEAKIDGIYGLVVRPFKPEAAAGRYEAKLITILEPERHAELQTAVKAKHVTAPVGWRAVVMEDCELSRDTGAVHQGGSGVRMTCTGYDPLGIETYRSRDSLVQSIRADSFRGKRVRLSGWIRPSRVGEWARLWMRVDNVEKTFAFDNMAIRLVQGTGDWQQHDIVLDVPNESKLITDGIALRGKGTVWVDDLTFREVGSDVQITNMAEVVVRSADRTWPQDMRDRQSVRESAD